jgi:hypothetical protein
VDLEAPLAERLHGLDRGAAGAVEHEHAIDRR